jgi:Protein of unknown function (DUF3634)
MEHISILLTALGVCGLCMYAARPRPHFVLMIQNGKVRVIQGHPPPLFLQDVEEIRSEAGINAATITGFRRAKQIVLRFSSNVPRNLQQRFRNAFGVHCR